VVLLRVGLFDQIELLLLSPPPFTPPAIPPPAAILGSGMPDIVRMLALGIPVAISTDGSGSADNQNILAAARLAAQYQKALHCDASLLPAQKLLEAITVVPAQVVRESAGGGTG